ncbi:large conductance mechanosensitive channel protein MscL [Alsobacter sp. R-9]
MIQEFKDFAMKGNVVDLAVGVVIGAAFTKIVDSIVGDLIMPVIGAITGGLDFSNYYLPLSSAVKGGMAYEEAKKAGAVFGYGSFLTNVVTFVIVAWALFIVVKGINQLRRNQAAAAPAAPPPPTKEEVLLTEIRDLLARKA